MSTEPAINGHSRTSIIDLAIQASLDDNARVDPIVPGSAWKAADAQKASAAADNAERVARLILDVQKAIYASRDGWRERVAEMLAKIAQLTGAAAPPKPSAPAHSVATIRTRHAEPGYKYTISKAPAGPEIPLAAIYQWSREGFKGWNQSDSLESAMQAAANVRANGGIGHVRECIGNWTTIVS